MLEDIEVLRTTMREHDEIDDAEIEARGDEGDGTGLLFGATKPLPLKQIILKFLPPRPEADRFVAAYFRAKAVAAPFIHAAHFRRLYSHFWDAPSATPALWASILFSIFDIATRALSTASVDSSGEKRNADRYATAAAHCLAVGEYHKPQRFSVEALLLYAQSRCLTSVDLSPDVGILFGTLVRLATTMGYHRDPNGARTSIFEMEMRRRTWSLCVQLDMLVSFQLGLPSNIQFPTWDTKPPANLLDSDFDEDTTQLPPARPDSESTELLFYIAKHRLMATFEKIIRHTLSTIDRSEEELVAIEQELRNTYEALPRVFQPRLMVDSIVDSPSIVVARLCVGLIYRKSLCVLHRKYILRGRQKSVLAGHEIASELVRQFVDIYKEFEPMGQLYTERWVMTSLSWHDFLLGCTTLCLTICSSGRLTDELTSATLVDIIGSVQLLRKAKAVFEAYPHRSKDTRKVLRLVDAIVFKYGGHGHSGLSDTHASLLNDQTLVSDGHWHAMLSPPGDKDWLYNEDTTMQVDDPTWAYMEQFLELPNDDFMADTI
ncbi:MAG: hypothetical protein MMC23_004701 [Stictis urceolatum]|nr:hypothetical protein [Stictis urceolata]